MTEEKYVLTLTREQAITAQNALELYARLKIGQFDRITELMLDVRSVDEYCQRRDDVNDLLKVAACIIFGRNEHGQPNCQKDELHYRAWNIYTALRYQMARHDNPEGGWGVHFDKPYPWGGEAVPECRVENTPNADAEPGRHGRWLPYTVKSGPLAGCTCYRCSCCGRDEEDNGEPYCHCGAKMDAKEDEQNDQG